MGTGPGIIRKLKGAPLAVLALLVWAAREKPGVGVTNAWLCTWSGYSDKPVANALAYLEGEGMAVRAPAGGWIAAHNALQLPLFAVDNSVDNSVDELASYPQGRGESRKNSDSAGSLKSSQSINTSLQNQTDLDSRGGEIPTEKVLQAAERLFGERPYGDNYPDLQHLLAWVAQAWAQRDKLRAPARVVYAHARFPDDKRHRPRGEYREWWNYLPDAFIRDAGLEALRDEHRYARYALPCAD